MKTIIRTLIWISILTNGCESKSIRTGTELNELQRLSFSELEENHESYQHTKIDISGYFNYGFEDVALFRTKYRTNEQGIWIEFSDSIKNDLKEEIVNTLNGRKIRIQGKFNTENKGHLNMFIGTIEVEFIETTEQKTPHNNG